MREVSENEEVEEQARERGEAYCFPFRSTAPCFFLNTCTPPLPSCLPVIPKAESVFAFELDNYIFNIYGNQFRYDEAQETKSLGKEKTRVQFCDQILATDVKKARAMLEQWRL